MSKLKSSFFRKTSLFFLSICFVSVFFSGCKLKESDTVLIWTNKSEVVSYAELFNASQDKFKVVIAYKDQLSLSLPPAKDEKTPDIVIGTGIRNERTKKNFIPIGYLLHSPRLKKSNFYESVLDVGKIGKSQYLLPISFNLPIIILAKENSDMLSNDYFISLDELRDVSVKYNHKNQNGIYTSMGFSPRWNPDFIYNVAKMQDVDFKSFEKYDKQFSWNKTKLDETISYLKNWTTTNNTSSTAEDDYSFKYLYMPAYKLVSENRCLFQFSSSGDFFSLPEDKVVGLEYRWLSYNDKIPVEDDVAFIGIYKKSANTKNAENFIFWLMNEENQKKIIERKHQMKSNSLTFGMLGGFSALKNVNEKTLTIYIPMLRKNLPISDYINPINVYPEQWSSIKESVLYPYLLDAIATDLQKEPETIDDRMKRWKKQYF